MKRILIVDDALELGRLLQSALLTLDPSMTIHVVPSAEEALLMAARMPLNLLVSDIRLPGMSGFDLVKKIRARQANIKVLVITGVADSSFQERALLLGVDGFFRKPLDMVNFIEAARRSLELPPEAAYTPPAGPQAAAVERRAPRQTGSLVNDPQPAPHESLSELISGLRQRVSAAAIFVLDDRGRVAARAGDVPDLPWESQWAAPVMAALSAGEKLSRLVSEGEVKHVMAFPGKDIQLVLAPAGDYALLVLFKPGHSVLRMAVAVEEALEIQQSLGATLAGIAPKLPRTGALPSLTETYAQKAVPPELVEPGPPPKEDDEKALADFEALLKKSGDHLKDRDPDEFWESLAAHGQPGSTANPDMLSYDQARKLGLAPKEEK